MQLPTASVAPMSIAPASAKPALIAGSPFSVLSSFAALVTLAITLAGCSGAEGFDDVAADDLVGTSRQALGEPVLLPEYIDAENYVAFKEVDAFSNGDCATGDGVDIRRTIAGPGEGGCHVGWTQAGEWLEYDIEALTTGFFNFSAQVASATGNRAFHLELDGVNIGSLRTPNQGWDVFAQRTISSVLVTAGVHKLRVVFDESGTNLDSFFIGEAPMNLFANPTFDTNLNGWRTHVAFKNEDAITYVAEGGDFQVGAALFQTNGAVNNAYDMQLYQTFPARQGDVFTLSFDVATTGANPRDVTLYIQEDGNDWTKYGNLKCAIPGDYAVRCELSATVTETTNVKFGIQGADNLWDFTVDNAVLKSSNPRPGWVRVAQSNLMFGHNGAFESLGGSFRVSNIGTPVNLSAGSAYSSTRDAAPGAVTPALMVTHTAHYWWQLPQDAPTYPGEDLYTIGNASLVNNGNGQYTWSARGWNSVDCSGTGCKFQPAFTYSVWVRIQ